MKRSNLLVVPFLIMVLAVGGAFAAGADDLTKGKGPGTMIDTKPGPGDLQGKDKKPGPGDLKGKDTKPGPVGDKDKGKP
jgi:hypothetical protein